MGTARGPNATSIRSKIKQHNGYLFYGVRIWNKRAGNTPVGVIHCGRTSIYGNPFVIGEDGTRDQVCDKFAAWLDTGEGSGCKNATENRRQAILKGIPFLKGKDLECWCCPSRCHCETLARLANV